MLEVRDLHRYYGDFHAVCGIDFDVARGEVVGFLGPNGAGKTTTMKIIVGYMAMSWGTVRVDGLDVVRESLAVRRLIGYLPEHAPLWDDMTVLEYLRFIAEVRGLKGADRKRRIDHVLGVCGLAPRRRAGIATLSKGYRQRVGLAQAIVHEPKLVILDEPTVGLDPNQIIEIRELLREIGRENTVILSSHILSEVEATCGRVIIAAEGRIVAEGTPSALEEAHADELVLRVRAGGSTLDGLCDDLPGGGAPTLVEKGEDARAWRLATADPRADAAELHRRAAERGVLIEELAIERPSLEDVFKRLTRRDAVATTSAAAEEPR